MQTTASGLTELTEAELKKLLRHVYRGELPCPISADTLACVGFQSRHEWISAALRGLDAAGVRAVLVAVIAERRKAAEATRAELPPDRRGLMVVNEAELEWREAGAGLQRKPLSEATGGGPLVAEAFLLDAGQRSDATVAGPASLIVTHGRPILSRSGSFLSLQPGDYVSLSAGDYTLIAPGEASCRYIVSEVQGA
jgi:hypothetical protein